MVDRRPSIRRNSLRYPGYDYSQPGCVFVTICTHSHQRLFGSVVDGEMWPSPQGVVAERYLHAIPDRVPDVIVDAVVVMPDHIHAILMTGTDPDAVSGASIPGLIHDYKISYRAAWRAQVDARAWPPYARKLWQRGYYDRIVRSERELDATRDYILANPGRWWERQQSQGAVS